MADEKKQPQKTNKEMRKSLDFAENRGGHFLITQALPPTPRPAQKDEKKE